MSQSALFFFYKRFNCYVTIAAAGVFSLQHSWRSWCWFCSSLWRPLLNVLVLSDVSFQPLCLYPCLCCWAAAASSLLHQVLPLLWLLPVCCLPGFGPVGESVSGGCIFLLGVCLLIKVATSFGPVVEILKGSRRASASSVPHTNSSNRSEVVQVSFLSVSALAVFQPQQEHRPPPAAQRASAVSFLQWWSWLVNARKRIGHDMSSILGSRFMVQMLLRKRNGMNKYAILHAANPKRQRFPTKKSGWWQQ